ncbi:MAG: cytochrome c biogenesis protein ResB [bacterium]|nr:cytochrome c biogenesis protein ResB [bacterium]
MKRFFSSPKLTFILLILLASLAIIGTIIPQNEPHYLYIEKYGYNLYRLLKIFSITDVYHSWWFIGLLEFLSLNIIICALNRLKTCRQTLTKPRQLGYFATHLSFLIILSGGMIGSLWGFKDNLYLKEGEVRHVPQTNFHIKLNKFWLEYYPDSKMIKDYKSNLTIIENEKEILTKTIEVNEPLSYKGIRFYQASYEIDVNEKFHHFYYSGLQVVKDPGVWVVWLGCSLLMLGLIMGYIGHIGQT